jgi:hypothetical protein
MKKRNSNSGARFNATGAADRLECSSAQPDHEKPVAAALWVVNVCRALCQQIKLADQV